MKNGILNTFISKVYQILIIEIINANYFTVSINSNIITKNFLFDNLILYIIYWNNKTNINYNSKVLINDKFNINNYISEINWFKCNINSLKNIKFYFYWLIVDTLWKDQWQINYLKVFLWNRNESIIRIFYKTY
jgi:hypothetical protein